MCRSHVLTTLVLALACTGLAQGQATRPNSTPPEARVGKVITVTEVGRPGEKCLVQQVWRLPDGSPAMLAKTLSTGEMLSIVESPDATNAADRFRVFHWGPGNVPPVGCPLPPSMTMAAGTSSTPVAAHHTYVGAQQMSTGGIQLAAAREELILHPPMPVETSTQPKTDGAVIQASGTVTSPLPPTPVTSSSAAASAQPAKAEPGPAPKVAEPAKAVVPQGDGKSCVGRIITVCEHGGCPQRCVVISESCGLNGTRMEVRSCETGECMTIVERPGSKLSGLLDRFRLIRGKHEVCCTPPCICEGEPCAAPGAAPTLRAQPSAMPAAPAMPLPKPATTSVVKPEVVPMKPVMTAVLPPTTNSILPPSEPPAFAEQRTVKPTEAAPVVQASPAPPLAVTAMESSSVIKTTEVQDESRWQRMWSRFRRDGQNSEKVSEPVFVQNPEMQKTEKVEAMTKAETKTKSTLVKESTTKPTVAKDAPTRETATKDASAGKSRTSDVPTKPAPPAEVKPKEEVVKRTVAKSKESVSAIPTPPPAFPEKSVDGPAKEERLPVPVPLVPLATADARPEPPPPQPPIAPFSTMKSTAVTTAGHLESKGSMAPMCPTCRRSFETPEVGAQQGIQQVQATEPYPLRGKSMMPPSPVSPNTWTAGPAQPVSQTPVMVGSRGIMTEREALSMQNTVQLMTVLQSSGVPAQREWAAARLRNVDPQLHAYVVEALVNCAKTDGAAMVRAAAIQSLVHMRAQTPAVLSLLEGAKQDRDPRVRDEATQALATFTGGKASPVQPAKYEGQK